MLLGLPLVVVFLSLPFSVTSLCYYADHTEAKGLQPCDPDAEFSHCCRSSDVCVTNGLCFSTGLGSLVRRGCTDSAWNNSACPSVCPNSGIQEPLLTYCGEYNKFCCGGDKAARECCDTSNSTLGYNITSGEALHWPQSTGEKTSKATRNALIALTAVFGTGFLVAAWFAYKGRDGLKKEHQSRAEVEAERKGKIAAQQNLQNLENALKYVRIPPNMQEEIENARGPRVPLDSMDIEQDEIITGRDRR